MKAAALLILALATLPTWADDTEYRPGGREFAPVWDRFYRGDHEPELDDPLIAAGPNMTLTIVEAVKHKDMKMRRYAIGALGQTQDKRALPHLEQILKDKSEVDHFRGDALHAIYRIDQTRGTEYAKQFEAENDYLKMMADFIKKRDPWLLESTDEH